MQYKLKTLARRLKERRAELGLSLEDVSDEIDYSVSTISTWETGIRQPRADGLFWISKFYDVSVDWLLGLSDEKYVSQRTGKWFGTVCSACGNSTSFYDDCEYCPRCGTRMEVTE